VERVIDAAILEDLVFLGVFLAERIIREVVMREKLLEFHGGAFVAS
jgi:hypothetical protein